MTEPGTEKESDLRKRKRVVLNRFGMSMRFSVEFTFKMSFKNELQESVFVGEEKDLWTLEHKDNLQLP